MNKIGQAQFLTPTANVSTWTRFAVAFNYVSASNPAYIMINTTSSYDQNTSTAGSKLWIDDLSVVYNTTSISENAFNENNANVYAYDKTIHVDFLNANQKQATLSIYDLTGKLVGQKLVSNSSQNAMSVSELNSGLYMYQLIGTEIHKSGKLFIK